MDQDANSLASLPISITVASLPAIELWQTHAGRRLSFWQEPLNGIALRRSFCPQVGPSYALTSTSVGRLLAWIPMWGLRLNKMAPEPPRSPLKSQGSDAKGCI